MSVPAPRIVTLAEIEAVLPHLDIVGEMERGFVAYSRGEVDVPPVGELLFPDRNGELHIKYGAIRGDSTAVIKIATGFYDNPTRGLPPFGGLNLLMDATTGLPRCILLDEGHLTNIRTAAAGAVAARHLARHPIGRIGILGSGTQARLQADCLRRVTDCRALTLWARDADKARTCARDLEAIGFEVDVAPSPAAVAAAADVIVTTTASSTPLLRADDIRPGTHITAMGSDTPHKTELDPAILAKASAIVADSRSQCLERGEIHHAVQAGLLDPSQVFELGDVISGRAVSRQRSDDITVADLTGVAIQDIMIAKAVLARLG